MTRKKMQEILDRNPLNAFVSYKERNFDEKLENVIVYERVPDYHYKADDQVYKKRVTIAIHHFHKKKLDSIEDFLCDEIVVDLIDDYKEDTSEYYHAVYHTTQLVDEVGWYG